LVSSFLPSIYLSSSKPSFCKIEQQRNFSVNYSFNAQVEQHKCRERCWSDTGSVDTGLWYWCFDTECAGTGVFDATTT